LRDQVRFLRTKLLAAGVIAGLAAVCATAARIATAAGSSSQAPSGVRDDARAQAETVRTIRSAGVAMYSWWIDQPSAGSPKSRGMIGQPGDGAANPQQVYLTEIAQTSYTSLAKLLVPLYIQKLPERDGWGNPLEYRLNLASPNAISQMSIRSPGRDGKFSCVTCVVGAFPSSDYDHDIVWADGFFVQWPN